MRQFDGHVAAVSKVKEKVARAIVAQRISRAHVEPLPENALKMHEGDIEGLWPSAVAAARAAIAAFEVAVAGEGKVIVPREPTSEIVRIGALYCNGTIAARFFWEDLMNDVFTN